MAENKNMGMEQAYTKAWIDTAYQVWKYIVRPIAIGGMLVGASYTLFKMRNSLTTGIVRAINDVKKAAKGEAVDTARTDKDLSFIKTLSPTIIKFFSLFSASSIFANLCKFTNRFLNNKCI